MSELAHQWNPEKFREIQRIWLETVPLNREIEQNLNLDGKASKKNLVLKFMQSVVIVFWAALNVHFFQCCGSMKFWYGSGSADLYLWLFDLGQIPIRIADPPIFVSDIQDFNKTLFFSSSKDPNPYPYLWLMDPDADPGGPKTYESYGSRSATLGFY